MHPLLILLALSAPAPQPPRAKQVAHASDWRGERVDDPYFWLRNKNDAEVVRHLQAENAYSAVMMEPVKAFEDTLYKEIKGRTREVDVSVPYRFKAHDYYRRTVEGGQYPVFGRKTVDGGAEQVLLDQNAEAKDKKFFAVSGLLVSDDETRLAYTIDDTGFRQYKLVVKDVAANKVLPDSAERVTSLAWAADNRTLFYTQEDAVTKRSHRLYRHVLGEAKPTLLFEEKDDKFNLEVSHSRDRQWLFVSSGSFDTSEVFTIATSKPAEPMQSLLGRTKGVRYEVEHHSGRWYVRTDKDAKDFRVVSMPVGDTKEASWQTFVAHTPGVLLQGLVPYQDFIVVEEISEGLRRFSIYETKSRAWHSLQFPEGTYTANVSFDAYQSDFSQPLFRYMYTSLTSPVGTYDYDVAAKKSTLRKQQEIVGGYDAGRYKSERLWVKARDGTKIPVSIVYPKTAKRDGSEPLFLTGYGAYGFGLPATFQIPLVSLLDRGVAYAIAHIRGGDEMGEKWHDQGKLFTKKNTFYDFIDVADALVADKWAARDRLIIEGASAGGLLIGAVVNMRPDLCRVAHLGVPFVDVMNTMFDTSLPLTSEELIEWGDPRDANYFEYMRSYSPYDNIAKKPYPALLVTTSFNDSQVMYWEPAKYVAKLRANKTDKNPLLLRIKMEAGHGGASGRYDKMKERAGELAWLLAQVGVGQ